MLSVCHCCESENPGIKYLFHVFFLFVFLISVVFIFVFLISVEVPKAIAIDCGFGFRLNITVKDELCRQNISSEICSGHGLCISTLFQVC